MEVKTTIKPKKNSINLLFRCDEERYLKQLLFEGTVHFGKVVDWINGNSLNNDCM